MAYIIHRSQVASGAIYRDANRRGKYPPTTSHRHSEIIEHKNDELSCQRLQFWRVIIERPRRRISYRQIKLLKAFI